MNISNKCGKHPNNEIFIKMEFPYPGKKGYTIVDSICKECFIEEIKESILKGESEDKKFQLNNKNFSVLREGYSYKSGKGEIFKNCKIMESYYYPYSCSLENDEGDTFTFSKDGIFNCNESSLDDLVEELPLEKERDTVSPRFGYKYRARNGDILFCEKEFHEKNKYLYIPNVILLRTSDYSYNAVLEDGSWGFERDGKINTDYDIVEELGKINDFDPTKPVMQRDGHNARIICMDSKHFHKDIIQPICALITINPSDESDELEEIAEFFYENGRFLHIYEDDGNDLINIE